MTQLVEVEEAVVAEAPGVSSLDIPAEQTEVVVEDEAVVEPCPYVAEAWMGACAVEAALAHWVQRRWVLALQGTCATGRSREK